MALIFVHTLYERGRWKKKVIQPLPLILRYSTMSFNTSGIPETICPSSFSVSKATPNTQLGIDSDSITRVEIMGSGLTLAVDRRIFTEAGSLCMKTGVIYRLMRNHTSWYIASVFVLNKYTFD